MRLTEARCHPGTARGESAIKSRSAGTAIRFSDSPDGPVTDAGVGPSVQRRTLPYHHQLSSKQAIPLMRTDGGIVSSKREEKAAERSRNEAHKLPLRIAGAIWSRQQIADELLFFVPDEYREIAGR